MYFLKIITEYNVKEKYSAGTGKKKKKTIYLKLYANMHYMFKQIMLSDKTSMYGQRS